MKINIEIGTDYYTSYIHTQRYFNAFLEYWTNFVELQDQVYKLNNKNILNVSY